MANVAVTFTQAQFNLVQQLLNQRVQDEATSNVAYSGDISNNPTFGSADLTLAEATLVALRVTSIG